MSESKIFIPQFWDTSIIIENTLVDMANRRIINLGIPIETTDAVTKTYVDTQDVSFRSFLESLDARLSNLERKTMKYDANENRIKKLEQNIVDVKKDIAKPKM